MKLFTLNFGQNVKIDLSKLDEDTKKFISSLFKMMQENLDKNTIEVDMVVMHPTRKGFNVAPSKGLGTMGHSVDVPRKAIIHSEPEKIDVKNLETEPESLILGKDGRIDDDDYEQKIFNDRIKNILQILDRENGEDDESI